jgi:hypothetical protein
MGRWLRFLEKAGLVELSPEEAARVKRAAAVGAATGEPSSEEIEALLESTRRPGSPPAPPAPPAPVVNAAPLGDPELFGGRDFAAIYAEAGVARAPYAAEQLLKVLDGLAAMAPEVRIAAVQAMDAADDAWTLGDPLLDARRKVEALERETGRLEQTERTAQEAAQRGLAEQDAYQAQATEQIRAQIAELEALLATELEQVAAERARLQARLDETRHAVAREAARYREEIARLRSLERVFPPTQE